ncbi:hypothetical protein [Listeria monocytogenes]|uniref:hypothetical protein n=1 Tax=Listeria monocytogenes TaxID=1639 RepID=UPI001FAFCFFF|nr:hypothetical protein [Listeria monocytogenes]
MKRDLKINFGILEQIRDELYQFMRALENMKSSINNIDNLLANASGKSIEAISQDKKGVITAIDTYKEQVNDVYVLISDYIGDMTSYIRPINQYGLMRVDRDDIWWNISQIEGANAVNVTKPSRYGYTPIAGYETDANNDLVAEQIEADIAYLKTRISGEISALWQIHDQQIAPFEDTDDHFKSRSETLYDRYTSWEERNKDIMLGIESGIYNFFSGLITGVIGIVDGIFSLIVNVIKYVGYGAVYLVTAPFGATPDHMQIYLEEANTILAAIGKDPTLIIEGMAQNISDTYEEKGIMYSIGAVVPDILVDIFLTKGLNKIGKIANFGDSLADVGKYADEIADAGKITNNTKKINRTLDELEDLAKDPAHAGKLTQKGIEEREVGLGLEELGEVSNLRRDPTGGAEFIDGFGQKWDVKGFFSEFAPKGYNLDDALTNIKKSIDAGENVMLDTRKMYPEHIEELLNAIEKAGLSDHIKVWPK